MARDYEAENGGAGVFNINLKDKYILDDEEWKQDTMPELLDGKNVYDYLDPDIAAKLQALEEEEGRLEQEGFYDSDDDDTNDANMDMTEEEIQDIKDKAQWIRNKQKTMIIEGRNRKSLKNKAIMPRDQVKKSFGDLEEHMYNIGYDTDKLRDTIGKKRKATDEGKASGVDILRQNQGIKARKLAKKKQAASQSDRLNDGVSDGAMRSQAERLAKIQRRERNRMARQGEGDRHSTAALPKHLFSGKRGIGSSDRR